MLSQVEICRRELALNDLIWAYQGDITTYLGGICALVFGRSYCHGSLKFDFVCFVCTCTFFILFISRLLEEEFARRAELERLQEQQAKLLAATQQERDALHGDRLEQERLLRETAQRLEQLEADRAAADEQMKVPYRTY